MPQETFRARVPYRESEGLVLPDRTAKENPILISLWSAEAARLVAKKTLASTKSALAEPPGAAVEIVSALLRPY